MHGLAVDRGRGFRNLPAHRSPHVTSSINITPSLIQPPVPSMQATNLTEMMPSAARHSRCHA